MDSRAVGDEYDRIRLQPKHSNRFFRQLLRVVLYAGGGIGGDIYGWHVRHSRIQNGYEWSSSMDSREFGDEYNGNGKPSNHSNRFFGQLLRVILCEHSGIGRDIYGCTRHSRVKNGYEWPSSMDSRAVGDEYDRKRPSANYRNRFFRQLLRVVLCERDGIGGDKAWNSDK